MCCWNPGSCELYIPVYQFSDRKYLVVLSSTTRRTRSVTVVVLKISMAEREDSSSTCCRGVFGLCRKRTPNERNSFLTNCKPGGYAFKVTLWFCNKFFKCPCPPFFLILMVLAHSILHVILAVLVYPPQIDLRLQSFQIPNHESSLHYDAFRTVAAQSAKPKNSDAAYNMVHMLFRTKRDSPAPREALTEAYSASCNGRSLARTVARGQYMDLIFVPPKGSDPNMFTKERLEDIHAIEMHIMSDPEYRKYCVRSTSTSSECAPLNTILTYFYPSLDGSVGVLINDGRGDQLRDINTTLAEVIQNKMAYWYLDTSFGQNNLKSSLIRSQIRISFPIKGYCSYYDRREEQVEKVNKYFEGIIPYLKDASTK